MSPSLWQSLSSMARSRTHPAWIPRKQKRSHKRLSRKPQAVNHVLHVQASHLFTDIEDATNPFQTMSFPSYLTEVGQVQSTYDYIRNAATWGIDPRILPGISPSWSATTRAAKNTQKSWSTLHENFHSKESTWTGSVSLWFSCIHLLGRCLDKLIKIEIICRP